MFLKAKIYIYQKLVEATQTGGGRTNENDSATLKLKSDRTSDKTINVGPDIGQKSDKQYIPSRKKKSDKLLKIDCPTAKSRSDTFFWGRTRKSITKFYRKRKIKNYCLTVLEKKRKSKK